jgi:hypothetical protein
MAEPQYVFPTVERLDRIVDNYIKLDSNVQMKMRNGMTRDLYFKSTLMQYFMNDNDIDDAKQDESYAVIPESIDDVAAVCAEHYHIPKKELVESYVRCTGFEFYDKERREKIEKQIRELKGAKESGI